MFKADAPAAVDLCNVPPAQQPMNSNTEVKKAEYRTWAQRVNHDVSEIINGRRSYQMTNGAKNDLCACMNLMDAKEPLEFDWDIELYTNPSVLKAPRVPTEKLGSIPMEKPYKDCDQPDDDYDDDDLDPVDRPDWNIGEVRILKLATTPFWGMARYIHTANECRSF